MFDGAVAFQTGTSKQLHDELVQLDNPQAWSLYTNDISQKQLAKVVRRELTWATI
jgi:hypothetical protein